MWMVVGEKSAKLVACIACARLVSVLVVMPTSFLAVDFVDVEGVGSGQWLGVSRMPRGNGVTVGEPDIVVASDFM